MKAFGVVYVVTNNSTGEQYVGQTRRKLRERWAGHVHTAKAGKHQHLFLASAMRKYGAANFAPTEVFSAFSENDLNWAEKLLIEQLKPAYNKRAGGAQGIRIVPVSDAERAIRSAVSTAMWKKADVRATITEKLRAKYLDPVYKENIRQHCLGRVMPRSAVERMRVTKYKPVLCEQLGITFLSRQFAAAHINVRHSTVSEAIRYGRKVFGKYSFRDAGALN